MVTETNDEGAEEQRLDYTRIPRAESDDDSSDDSGGGEGGGEEPDTGPGGEPAEEPVATR